MSSRSAIPDGFDDASNARKAHRAKAHSIATIYAAEDEGRLQEALKYLVECKEAAKRSEGA